VTCALLRRKEYSRLAFAAGSLEFFGGSLIALGLFARPVAFLLSGEPAVLYCFIFLYLATRGAGPLSLDAAVRGRGKSK
jgi:putative oxidoreductase